MKRPTPIYLAAGTLLALALLPGCNGKKASTSRNEREANAIATYVAPGEKDEYYLFYSGGHSGQVFVAGIPSMRHITTIPVFSPYPATGYDPRDRNARSNAGYAPPECRAHCLAR